MKPEDGRQPRKTAPPVPEACVPALRLLHEAAGTADAEGRDRWESALEARRLRDAGLNDSGLRQLLAEKLVEAAEETTGRRRKKRAFHRVANLRLTEHTSFVLTPAGAAALRRAEALRAWANVANANPPAGPRWDTKARILFFGGLIVKCYTGPAVNQERVLAAFEEERWPRHIYDPLTKDGNWADFASRTSCCAPGEERGCS